MGKTKAPDQDYLKPLVVRTRDARRLLGNMHSHKFWKLCTDGELDVIGNDRFRLVTVESIERWIARQQRAPYAQKYQQKLMESAG